MSYIESLYEQFNNIEFSIVNFDNGNTPVCMQCYLIAKNIPNSLLEDKGQTALDLGNYIYRRFGFIYEMPPEYNRSGEPKNSLAFYQNKATFQSDKNSHIREWLLKHDKTTKRAEHVLYDKHSIKIPHVAPYKE